VNRTKLNYWLDVLIGIALVAAFVSGIAFLFMGSGGYSGGRNATYGAAFLGVSRDVWRSLHTFTSFVMAAGVGLHLLYHYRWISCVTRRILPRVKLTGRTPEVACEITS